MYFAVAPNMRNKGYEAAFFTGAMFVLKEIGASYYIGETNVQNEWMKDILKITDVSCLVLLSGMCGSFRRMNDVLLNSFRGNPCTTYEQVKELLPVCKIKRKMRTTN